LVSIFGTERVIFGAESVTRVTRIFGFSWERPCPAEQGSELRELLEKLGENTLEAIAGSLAAELKALLAKRRPSAKH